MTKKEKIKSKILGFINPSEYINITKLKDKINPKKYNKYELKRTYYIQAIKNLFNSNIKYSDMIFELLEEEHFMYIYNNVLKISDIENIKNRDEYCRDYRSSEQLTVEMIVATIDEAFTIIDFRKANKDTHFNPSSTHTTCGELNGDADLIVYKNGSSIFLEQQTVDKKNDVLILKYSKYKKLKALAKSNKITYLLTKYINFNTGTVEYDFTLINNVIDNNLYIYVHNPNPEDTYYKQWVAFGKKAIVILKTDVEYKPL